MRSFSDYYYRSYSVKKGSYQNLFCILIYFLIFAVPFYFSFGGQNFWFEEKYDLLTLEYSFTGYYSIQIVYQNSSNIINTQHYSNIPGSSMNQLSNFDFTIKDNANNASINFVMNGLTDSQIQSFNGVFFYNVKIPSFDRIISAAYTFSVAENFYSTKIAGIMKLITSQPINTLTQTQTRTINRPAWLSLNLKAPNSYEQIIEAQFQNPFRLEGKKYKNIQGTNSVKQTRYLEISLEKVNSIILPYYPSILQKFKFNYSRYFGFLIVSYLIFRNVMVILIKQEGLQCNIQDQRPPM